jgi:hypothetical protein
MTEVDALVRQGIVYPRWFPDFGLGHGYPLFNFFPPLAYLITELAALPLANLAVAIQVSIAASMLVSGWGMYLLARLVGAGRPAAMVAGLLYLYVPYHIQDIYTRGGLPELWAMGWLPWLAWAQAQAVRRPSAPRIAAAGLLAGVEVATHNAVALFILPVAFVLGVAFTRLHWQPVLTSAACTALGLLFSAGYWLPGVLESGFTRVSQLQGGSAQLEQHTFDLRHLVDFVFYAPQGDLVYKLTALEAAVALALLAVVLWDAFHGNVRLPALAVCGLTFLFGLSLTRLSIPFWSTVPLVHYIQFPWRMLILIGFLLALMAALAGQAHRLAWAPLGAVTILMAISSLAQVQDRWFVPPPTLDARTLQAQEFGSALDGVAIESEYQPKTASPDVVYASQGRRAPADPTVAAPVQVQSLTALPTETRVTVSAGQPTVLRFQPFYFPGWHATLDGTSWPLQPGSPAGLVEAAIPAGSHTLDVSYTGTLVEGLSGLVSGAALLAMASWLLRRRPAMLAGIDMLIAASAALLTHPPVAQGAVNPGGWSPSAGQQLAGIDGLRVTPRGIEVDLFWLYTEPRESDFDFVLRDASGQVVRRIPATQASTMPYEYLAANELLRRRYTITHPPTGSYVVGLQAGSSSTSLGEVTVPGQTRTPHSLDARFQQQATLRSYWIDRVRTMPGLAIDDVPARADALLHPGDFLLLSLEWQAGQTLDQNYVEFVHLLDANGHSWAGQDNQPDGGLQATGGWVPGQTIPDRFLLKVPDSAPAGMYRLEVGMYHIDLQGYHFLPLQGGGNSVLFGSVDVQPASAPTTATPVARWDAPIILSSWRASQAGPDLDLSFDWTADGAIDRNYTLFVHLLNASGAVVAQGDSPPEQGQFPTSLWSPGDRVPDLHKMAAPPPGRYRLEIGWYRTGTGERLPLSSGDDALDLGPVEVR